MDGKILDHYRQFSLFTNPGLYKDSLAKELPDDVVEIGKLVKMNTIHRMMLAMGNTRPNADLKFGDMSKVPWWRQPEDDNLPTAAATRIEWPFPTIAWFLSKMEKLHSHGETARMETFKKK